MDLRSSSTIDNQSGNRKIQLQISMVGTMCILFYCSIVLLSLCCRRRRGEAQHSFPRCGIDGWKDLERRISKRGFERKCSPQHTAVRANRWNTFPRALLKCASMLPFARNILVREALTSYFTHAQRYESWWKLE